MSARRWALLLAAALPVVLAACSDSAAPEPRAELIILSKRTLAQLVGDTAVVDVQAVDSAGNPMFPSGVSFSSLDSSIAGVDRVPDSVLQHFPGRTLMRIIVRSSGMGRTKILATANGATDTIAITSYPRRFDGTIAPATAKPGDTLVITAPAGVTFSATATAAGVKAAFYKLVSRSATQLRYIAGGEMTQFTVDGALMLDTVPLPSLVASAAITVAQLNEAAGNVPTTGPVIAIPAAIGDSVMVFGSISGSDVHDYFTINGAVGDVFQVRVDWPSFGCCSDPDIDALLLNTAGTSHINTQGGTSANPETFTRTITATSTTSRLDVHMYDHHGHVENWPYRIRLYRR